MMNATAENVLILTLGTGSNIDKKIYNTLKPDSQSGLCDEEKKSKLREIFSSDTFCYMDTIYHAPETNGEPMEIESAFVAEPLVLLEKPNQIFIIGTVKSSWSSFYNKFADKNNKSFERFYKLFEIENRNGKDTGDERLREITALIEEIYREDKVFHSLYSADEQPAEVHILLTKYGLNEEELTDNYKIISSIKDYFRKDRQYRIAFDITHSFRSIPIYDLVILNYLKHITEYHVEISHVYYGNVEVSKETGKAYIVDLKDLIHVLELTNGVGEFRDTGNAVALLNELSDSEEDLGRALECFDWATQMNDYQAIVRSVDALLQQVHTVHSSEKENRFTDLREMLVRVLENQFISEEKLHSLMDDSSYPDHVGEIQLCICKWFQNQNRYGLAIATALETLRSILVPFYLRRNGSLEDKVELTDCQNENNRKSAEDMLSHLYDYMKKGSIVRDTDELNLLYEIAKLKIDVKPIRNRFAHNLLSDRKQESDAKVANESNESDEYLNDKNTIDEFIYKLELLSASLKKNIAEAYYRKPERKETRKISSERDIRLIICNPHNYENLTEYEDLTKSKSSGKVFDVYFIPEALAGLLSPKKSKNQGDVIADAFLIRRYIEENFKTEQLTVVLDDLKFFQCVFYPAVLGQRNIKAALWQYKRNKDNHLNKMVQPVSLSYELNLDNFEEMESKVDEQFEAFKWTQTKYKLVKKSFAQKSKWILKEIR